jgi:predicted Zn-dependent protease
MAMAGYDPNDAVTFWERMMANSKGSNFEFTSTHPSEENRIANMKAVLPEALKYLKQ